MAVDAANSELNYDEEFGYLRENCKILLETRPHMDAVLSDNSLHRFLRAFGNAEVAFKAVSKCVKWREEFGVANITADDEDIQRELATGKVLILRHRDVKGRPVVYVTVRKHMVSERDAEKLLKFMVYILEVACGKCNEDVIDSVCVVFDLKGFGLSNMDYQFVKSLVWLLGRFYPERLGVSLVINSPFIFSGCWAIIRPWLNEVTASKVVFINNDQLQDYIHPDALPNDD